MVFGVYRVWGIEFRVQGLGFRIQGLGSIGSRGLEFRTEGFGFGLGDLGLRVWSLGLRIMVRHVVFRFGF